MTGGRGTRFNPKQVARVNPASSVGPLARRTVASVPLCALLASFDLLEFKLDPFDTLDTMRDDTLRDGPMRTRRETSEHF